MGYSALSRVLTLEYDWLNLYARRVEEARSAKAEKAYRVGYSGPVCFDVNLRPTCKTGGDNRTARNINE